jgi:hypothetical protein
MKFLKLAVLLTTLLITYSGISSANSSYRYQGALQGNIGIKGGETTTPPEIPPETPPATPQWIASSPSYTEWEVSGPVGACTTWTPSLKTLALGAASQSSSDCSVQKSRVKQNREQETVTQEYRDAGDPITEIQTFQDGTSTRGLTILSFAWATVGTPVCSTWTPDPDTVDVNQVFTQTGSNCTVIENYFVRYRVTGLLGIKMEVIDSKTSQNQTATRQAIGTNPISIEAQINLDSTQQRPIPGFAVSFDGVGAYDFTPQPNYTQVVFEVAGFSHDGTTPGMSIGSPIISPVNCNGTSCSIHITAPMTVEGNPGVTNVWNGKAYLPNGHFVVKITKVP